MTLDRGALSEKQQVNHDWWSRAPMTYEGRSDLGSDVASLEWFAELDRRLFDAAYFAHGDDGAPFGRYLWPSMINGASVLEIGCGMGSHAQLLAEAGARLTAVDLTERAVEITRRRLSLRSLDGTVMQADAESLPFEDASFDVVWSWGVLHHSSSFERCIGEVNRVIRPGGHLMIMVYHRPSLLYSIHNCVVRGLFMGQRIRRSFAEIYSEHSDGAYARMFRRAELEYMLSATYKPLSVSIEGEKSELFPIPKSTLKYGLERHTPDRVARAVLSHLGFFLIAEGTRR